MHDPNSDSYLLARALDRGVRRLNLRMVRVMPELDTQKIGPLGVMTILALSDLQPCSIQTLCTDLGRDNSQMTRLLNRLGEKHLVERHPDPNDGRASLVELTERGEEMVAEIRNAMAQAIEELGPRITRAQSATLVEILEQLAKDE